MSANAMAAIVNVTVVWATPAVQDVVPVRLPAGSTVATAITRSGLLDVHGIDPHTVRAGLNGRLVRDDTALRDGDRVELCRPLVIDPKAARRLRAAIQDGVRTPRPGK